MATITMALVPPPHPASGIRGLIRHRGGDVTDPLLVGSDADDLICGDCDFLLARGVDPTKLGNVVFQCPRCTHHNALAEMEVPG